MHIQTFHRKFTSTDEQGNLFQALRNLSLAEDYKSMFSAEDDTDWLGWPPVE